MKQVTVVKIGGNIIDSQEQLLSFLNDFAAIEGYKILVHGGGKVASEIGKRLGIEPHYHNGRRITDAATLEVVTMVYGGLINTRIVAALQNQGCNAIGLKAADGGILPAVKRPVKEVDFGFVGDITSANINAGLIHQLLLTGLSPVFAPLTFSTDGNILNTNADTIAQEIAKSLTAFLDVQLIYCFEKRGVLRDPADDGTVISSITKEYYGELKDKEIISGGMLPKMDNAFEAIENGVRNVFIGHAADLLPMLCGKKGTCIK